MSEFYTASDYAGIEGGDYRFYYGYEYGREIGEDGEDCALWGFEVRYKGDVIFSYPVKDPFGNYTDTTAGLMDGVGKFLDYRKNNTLTLS